MSSDTAICVEGVSKSYQIYDKPHQRLLQMLVRRRKFFREFLALRNVSFSVSRGEVVGIIGRNGSGKSTLLQAICGTLNPTSGSIETHGRIAALLELGSGFNPEFTGRENVYLNATVLGLNRDQIDARFDDIALFAGIGEFLDQQVKTYSSGMFVRLAFAVSIHVEPQILIVDEALSVGDIAFQNKCIEAIRRMVARGVTVLFVTHDLGTLQLLCSRVIWLDKGQVRAIGSPVEVSQDYFAEVTGRPSTHADAQLAYPIQQETGKAEFTRFRIIPGNPGPFRPGDTLRVEFAIRALEDLGSMVFGLSVYRSDGDWLVSQSSRDAGIAWPPLAAGQEHSGIVELAPLSLAPGEYAMALGATSEDYTLRYALTGIGTNFAVRSDVPIWGKFLHPCRWTVGQLGTAAQ